MQDRDCICSFSKPSFHVFITSVTLFVNCSDRRCLHGWKICFFSWVLHREFAVLVSSQIGWRLWCQHQCDLKGFRKQVVPVRIHKGLRAYYLKMDHCSDLTNKGWRHSGHIVLVASCFSLRQCPVFPCWCQFLKTTCLWDPSDYMITRPQLQVEDKLRPPPFGAQFPIDRI